MMTKKELAKFLPITGFNIWQAEKDYLQHLFLLFLSRHSKKECIFKGGTALQKAYGLNRFSIDLDFTCEDDKPLAEIMNKINSEITRFGYPSAFTKTKEMNSITFAFKIEGPLYDGSEKSISTLYIEISLREKVILEPHVLEIHPVYPDIQPYICRIMRMEEIMAEKVRAIMSRNRPRDVFDMWFLLKKGVKIDKMLANRKLEYYKMKFDKKDFIEAINVKKARWAAEMSTLLAEVPEFERIVEDISSILRK